MVRVEVCVDSVAGLERAINGGADRIELCAALSEGGLTPSAGFMEMAAGCGVPVRAMIRPRGGDFVFSEAEIAVMLADIDAARAAGLEGVVLGAAGADGRLDQEVLRRLVDRAVGLGRTLHRVIDGVPDLVAGVRAARDMGFDCVLSSGGKASAYEGRTALAEMCAVEGIEVMPGAGLSAANVADVVRATGAAWVHGSFVEGVGGAWDAGG